MMAWNNIANIKGPQGDTGDPGTTTWAGITDKPAVIAAGATQADARTAIGAGTSNLALGTTNSTAKAGDYQPASTNISDASTVGKAVLVATDAAAARSAIGAGTGNGTVSSLSDLSITSTAAELNILDGVTSTAAELNILDGVTSTAAELNSVDGIGTTKAVGGSNNGTAASLILWIGTAAQYTAVSPKDSSTVYIVTA